MVAAAYSNFLARRPYLGNIVTSAVLFATGDVVAQQLVDRKGLKNHDWARTGRTVIWGGGIYAPVVTTWFRYLDRVPMTNKIKGTLTRVALDQLVAAPVILTGFFTVMTLLEGKDLNAAKDKWKKQFWPTLTANWMLFVPFQALNMVIPLQYRLVAINLVNIPWNTFLSLQNAKEHKDLTSSTRSNSLPKSD